MQGDRVPPGCDPDESRVEWSGMQEPVLEHVSLFTGEVPGEGRSVPGSIARERPERLIRRSPRQGRPAQRGPDEAARARSFTPANCKH